MGTSANIGIKMPDGKIKAIYCGCNGYIEQVGLTLAEKYNSVKKINELMNLGNIHVLGDKIGSKHSLHKKKINDNSTSAYHRDGGYSWNDNSPDIHNSQEDYIYSANDQGAEYTYLWQNGEWLVYKYNYHSDTKSFESLSYLLSKKIIDQISR